ncbi:MAG: hypothetical protein ACYTEQ_31120 [Planctomycetota bacterium]|jgi:hypothetical protein
MWYEKHTLGQHAGRLCVVYETSDYSRPVIVRHWWPIGNSCVSDWKEDIGEALCAFGQGSFGFADSRKWPAYGLHRSISFRLVNGGQTQPIHTERVDFPAPKTRRGIELRYRDGEWQKLLKTRGWVAA